MLNKILDRLSNINKDDVLFSLEVMGKGMLSIFVVIILITLIVVIMGRISEYCAKRRSSKSMKQ